MPKTKGNRDLIRVINRSLILNEIKSSGSVGRADIARKTGLSPAAVTGITAELIKDGLILEEMFGDSSGGRPPILLAINPKGGYVIGIKLMETKVFGALTDLEANVVSTKEVMLESKGSNTVVEAICQLVNIFITSESIPEGKLLGVGIGLAGVMNHEEGIVLNSPYFGWENLPLGKFISDCLHVPVYMDNDVNTLTVAENLFGIGQGEKDFITITLGRGMGLGIMINNKVYRGASGGAGELGHIVLNPDGPVCSCGKRGCFEAYVSEPALVAQGQSEFGDQIKNLDDLIELANSGNPQAVQIFSTAGERIGSQIANLINVLSPGLIIIGGEGTRIGDLIFDPVQVAIETHIMPPLAGTFKIRVEPWGDDAWARGAACLVLDRIFNPPMVQ